eukprot:TRINITY_DN23749_c0_g1_i1.p1 TRINITY_DN23749_c0_g1~~TRINITY_DN23749_c0_g1_i1.p1  ORF type:complete len:939 (-),score=143.10 TRINITY_DN23749_c0_g1_i1:278-3067(-)
MAMSIHVASTWLWFLVSIFCVALQRAQGAAPSSQLVPFPPLALDDFEDDDCLEAPAADTLLHLMHELGQVLDQVLQKRSTGSKDDEAWSVFEAWSADGRIAAMHKLAPAVLGRPYCEPGKIAWLATTCLFLLRDPEGSDPQKVLECAASVDEDLLEQMTDRSKKHSTRFHLVLRSPWPAFRLLDLLVRLFPENGSTRMGACRKHMKWNSDPDVHDWPHFKPTLMEAVDGLVSNSTMFNLHTADGPLSRQYKARWQRVHAFAPMKEAIAFSDDVFDAYREHHYQAGCHLGVISCYALQLLLVNLRDVEGRLQKQVSSVAQLINIHAPYQHMVKTDWPVFRLLHFASLLQRAPPDGVWLGDEDELSASKGAAQKLVSDVEDTLLAGAISADAAPIAFFTFAWGWMSDHVGSVLERWKSLPMRAPLIMLARDQRASAACTKASAASNNVAKKTRCVVAPQRLGVEAMVAKYLALAAAARLGITAVWLDFDVFVVSDPTALIVKELAHESKPDLVFARHLMSESVSPAVVIARNSTRAISLLMGYASWLRENPFLLDHQGWDQYLNNRVGDFAGGFDYKGRNVTLKENEGPNHTFLPPSGIAPALTNWRFLSTGFGSGDGWLGRNSTDALTFFHFWGADESQEKLFETFYPPRSNPASQSSASNEIMLRYRRVPFSGPAVSALLGNGERQGGQQRSLHLVAISYAHGCCAKSLKKNQQQALKVGVDEARAYGKADLGPAWVVRNDLILSQKKGAGWWLWKPHLILKTLKDPAVPWNRGIVLWVDAGNYLHANPRPLLESSLQGSDVVALRLKWCLEADWTSIATLRQMNVSTKYAMVDRPQLGAYFLAFRKTRLSIAFVEEWLRLAEDPVALLGLAAEGLLRGTTAKQEELAPSFATHQADQSVFSILYKQMGFRPISLEEGHRVVTLARWRE